MTIRRLPRSTFLVLACATVVLTSCEDSTTPTAELAELRILTDPPVALVGSEIALTFFALDAGGLPVQGVPIGFALAHGGSITPAQAVTDLGGLARAVWTLGANKGDQLLRVFAGDVVQLLNAVALADAPDRMEVVSGGSQVAAAGNELPTSVVAVVRDRFGNGVPDVTVEFEVTSGGGSVSAELVRTDGEGQVRNNWTLGPDLGANTLRAGVGGAVGLTFSATAIPGDPDALLLLTGDGQTASVGFTLIEPVVVQVVDRFDHPVPGTRIDFVPAQGEGAVDPPVVFTGDDGRALSIWTLGPVAGAQDLEVRAGNALVDTVQAVATAGDPSTLTISTGDDQAGTVGAAVAADLVVTVHDANGNVVAGAVVEFSANDDGSVDPPTAVTNGAGQAGSTWTLGPIAGTQTAVATVGTLAPVTFSATATADVVAELSVTSGDAQSGVVAQALSNPTVVRAVDRFGNVVPSATVSFTSDDGGSFNPASGETDSQGLLPSRWTLGPVAGPQTGEATADGVAPVRFTATGTHGNPATVEVASGDGQTGVVGEALAQPIVVTVRDAFGNVTPGQAVVFAPVSGGTTDPSQTSTDASGQSQTTWTLGTTAGAQSSTATLQGLTPVTFTATGSSSTPAGLGSATGSAQSGTAGGALGSPITITVLDGFGNPVVGASVQWVVTAGGGSTDPGTSLTDGTGVASTVWTLGGSLAVQTVEARLDESTVVEFTATATAAEADGVSLVSGDAQTGTAGSVLAQTLVAVVADEFGNPVEGTAVSFATSDGGSLNPATVFSDVDGLVSSTWTLGTTAGAQSATARFGVATPATYSATAVAGPAATLAGVSGDAQTGEVADPLPNALVVVASDQFGNPVQGVTVTFTPSGAGIATPATAVTGTDGQASTTWTLHTSPGANTLVVDSEGLDPVTLTATGEPPPADDIVIQSGDAQTAEVATTLTNQLVALVLDDGGVPIEGLTVTWAVVTGGGSLNPSSVVTDINGLAATAWTLGTTAGAQSAQATVEALTPLAFNSTATAAAAATLNKTQGDNQDGIVGTALAQSVMVEVVDAFGNPVSGVDVSFNVTAGGGSANPATFQTAADGLASTIWTLGAAPGTNTLDASVVGLTVAGFTATGQSTQPTTVTVSSGDTQTGVAGAALALPVVIEVTDVGTNPVEGALVLFSTASGGSPNPVSALTGADGRASTTWTLGTTAGAQTLDVAVNALSPVTVDATATAGAAATVTILAGDNQSATVATDVAIAPSVEVADQFGNLIEGEAVTFAVASGGGSATGTDQTTDAAGVATVGSWTLGSLAGENTLTATAAALSPATFTALGTGAQVLLDLDIRYVNTPTAGQQAAFDAAEARWEAIITGDLADAALSAVAGACGIGHPAINETVDDVLIYVELTQIDGVGGILGQAGPCFIRLGSNLPAMGTMQFDTDDLDDLEAAGQLDEVILHEMGHVLGIGTLWDDMGLLTGEGGSDPFFTGPLAIAEYTTAGGALPNPVPVENEGPAGTRDAHWRESDFDSELMTGYLENGATPLSAITIASLEDQGYTVDIGQAEAYAVPGTGAPLRRGPQLRLVERPVAVMYVIDASGRIVRTIR